MPPYTEKQKRLFRAAAHSEEIARKNNMTTGEARKLMEDAEKYETKPPVKSDRKKKA
jgi:hypothetical protein